MLQNFLLDTLSLLAILSGILVIISRNPVISVLFLISVFVNVAGYLVLLGVGFLGLSYLIVYVGAIAILFLFIIMLINVELAELSLVGSEYTQNLPLGALIGTLFLYEVSSILPYSFKEGGMFTWKETGTLVSDSGTGLLTWLNSIFLGVSGKEVDLHQAFSVEGVADTNVTSSLQIASIGEYLYTTGSMWLLLTSVILLLAIVGPIVLTLTRSGD